MLEKVNEAFKNLRQGFKFSLITNVLIVLYSILCLKDFLLYLLFPFGLPLLLLLFTWAYSLIKRHSGWSLLGQNSIAKALSWGGVTIFIFIFPLTTLWIYVILYYIGASLFSTVLINTIIMLLPPVAWGIYTWMENRGFKTLKQNYNINLISAQVCSLTGMIIYCFTYSVLYLLSHFHIYFNFIPYFYAPISSYLIISFLFASPLLITSCVFAIMKLRVKNIKKK